MSRSMGVITVQGLKSVSTVAQMALFALTLPRADFDDYAVWFTGGMFVIGLGQAIGTERVLIGRRTMRDGTASAKTLALTVGAVQFAVAAVLSSPPLMLAALGVTLYVAYDFQRLTRCFEEPALFVRADLTVLVLQAGGVLALWGLYGSSPWLALVWWILGIPVWAWLAGREGTVLGGLQVLRDDARDCVPLLVDAALSGVPLVAALALAKAQGDVGVASEARMAMTILGPVTVLNMSARRLIYQEAANGPFSRRFTLVWAGICVVALGVCVGLLSLTRTPLYPWAFPGFVGLSWVAILGFSLGHTAGFSLLLPGATLRADRRTIRIGAIRVLGTLAAAVTAVALLPFDDPADVAWTAAAGQLLYAAGLWTAHTMARSSPDLSAQPDPEHAPEQDADPDAEHEHEPEERP